MKFLPTALRSGKIVRTFFFAFLLLTFNSLEAQDYVSSSVAKVRLTDKANQLDAQLEQGTLSQIDHTINTKLIKMVLNEIGDHDFVWSAEHSVKITTIFENALQTAQTSALQDHPQYANKIDTIKEELDTLLKQ